MRSLLIYYTYYGNTKLIAEAICSKLGEGCRLIAAKGFHIGLLENIDLLVIGSPIIAWNPADEILNTLSILKDIRLKGIFAASFDTRIKMLLSGDAAKKISKILKKAGADILIPPKGFYVKGKQGPLLEGELKKAIEWTEQILKKMHV